MGEQVVRVLGKVGEEVVVVWGVIYKEVVVESIQRICGAVLLCPVDILPRVGRLSSRQVEIGNLKVVAVVLDTDVASHDVLGEVEGSQVTDSELPDVSSHDEYCYETCKHSSIKGLGEVETMA